MQAGGPRPKDQIEMSDRPSNHLDNLDIEMARSIDELCRRFEAEWRAARQHFSNSAGLIMNAALEAELFGNLIFLLVFAGVLWLWLRIKTGSVTRASLTSFVLFGYGLCRTYLRYKYPDPRQDPAGQGLGWAYPLIFWTAVSAVFAMIAAGLVLARFRELKGATRVLGLAPLVLFLVLSLCLCTGIIR
jgi:hypothetical protein